MNELLTLERQVQQIYEAVLRPLAQRVGFDIPERWQGASGSPNVLFLGNHSSGKSSFINFLLNTELQKSGLAPTDDGFTIITYGEKRDEFDGQTVATHRDLTYSGLQKLGTAFLSRLRLKTYPHDLLRAVTLIDSPGMIDAAGKGNTRGYDFAASVRYFAEHADLILFFFDPDKPGTTGETVSIFTETLTGLEYKLLIILNKVDLFSNIRDFARTYGTLSWNLAKNIGTKDIPHIFNIYVPGQERTPRPDNAILLTDFDVSREEVMREISRTPTRRADNLVSSLFQDTRKLVMHARTFQAVSQSFKTLCLKWWLIIAAELIVTGLVTWVVWDWQAPSTRWFVLVGGIAVGALLLFIGRLIQRRWKARMSEPPFLDQVFHEVHQRELSLQDRADLRALWEGLRERVGTALEVLGPSNTSNRSLEKMISRAQAVTNEEVPRLRRGISKHLSDRALEGAEPSEKQEPTAPVNNL